MRANVNIARKQRHTLTLGNFKGVDLSASPLRVSTSRASYMRNLWSENGANHKRPGWREMFALDGKINGVFPFEEGGTEVLLVHAGTKLYRVTHLQGIWAHSELRAGLTDTSSQCFYRDGRAYIIGCGEYLTYGLFDEEYALKDVSEIAYVPTTTISIGRLHGDDGGSNRATFEPVNLLTTKRKNTLVGVQDAWVQFELDSKVPLDSSYSIEMDFYYKKETGSVPYSGKLIFEGNTLSRATHPDGRAPASDKSEIYCADEKRSVQDLIAYIGLTASVHPTLHASVGADGSVYVEYCFTNGIPGAANITVSFQSNSEDHSHIISDCKTGTMFGAGGCDDRLFIPSPDEKGMDRWSEAGDFTYFPDGNAMFVGGGESSITGYARLSDGVMAVFKEEKAGYPTVYYRTSAQTTMEDTDGYTVTVDYFPVKAGVASDGLVTPRATATLAGDPLILTPSGVYGVELSQNVASGERYTRERSRAIREDIRKKDLSSAVAIVYRGRYYLSPGDGTCYVADARYKATFEGSPDANYEWWVWDNVPATAFAEYADSLLFGTAEGRVCAFNENIYTDTSYIQAQSGHLTVNADEGYITYGGGIELRVKDSIVLDGVKYTVTRVDEAENRLWLKDEQGNNAPLQSGFLTGTFERVQPVISEWASAVMDLGTSMSRKTLLSLGVTLEPGVRGATRISLETRDGAHALVAQNGHDFDFGALDLGDLSFTGSFAASTTQRMNLRNFNFIRVLMRSDTPTDMAVSDVVLEYKINQTNRGYY